MFSGDGSAVSLSLSPKALGTNKREDHRLQLVIIPDWRERNNFHPFCRVMTLRFYLVQSESRDGDL